MNGMLHMDGGGGGGGGGDSSSTGMMTMVFHNNYNTPLYSSSWTPTTTAAYAGTCIFLIVLAVIARLLLAARSIQEARWLDHDRQRRYVVARGKKDLAQDIVARHDDDDDMNDEKASAKTMTLSANGVEESVVVVARRGGPVRPWRFSVDPLRALLDTVIVGVGYLLMLAVMTMNVGYFLSVLGGVLLGSLAVGRYSGVGEH